MTLLFTFAIALCIGFVYGYWLGAKEYIEENKTLKDFIINKGERE